MLEYLSTLILYLCNSLLGKSPLETLTIFFVTLSIRIIFSTDSASKQDFIESRESLEKECFQKVVQNADTRSKIKADRRYGFDMILFAFFTLYAWFARNLGAPPQQAMGMAARRCFAIRNRVRIICNLDLYPMDNRDNL